ncbi:MAG TPA: DUF2188 domain-containing protein [Solirubrobacteraceae bacterium]|jgi:hypothetical protein
MPDVHVTRHGQRWAVADDPAATPVSEHATREEAESAARALAAERGGGEVIVSDEDPSGLAGHEDRDAGEREDLAPKAGTTPYDDERLRGEQASF